MSLPAVHKLQYKPWNFVGPRENNYQALLIDVFRDLSFVNNQYHAYTTSDGHLKGVYADVTIRTEAGVAGDIIALQNSWKLRNAVRKFHFRRLEMFENAGVTEEEMGTYGKLMRPFFDREHAESQIVDGAADVWNVDETRPYRVKADITEPAGTTNVGFWEMEPTVGGSWERSQVAASEPATDGDAGIADEWYLHLADGHLATGSNFDSVGMIQAYNEDRMEVVTPSVTESIQPQNPLALLTAQAISGGIVTDIAEDQETETPPYDIQDFGDSIHKYVIDNFSIVPYTAGDGNTSGFTIKNLWLPAGYLGFAFAKMPATVDLDIVVDVKAVWECRELA